MVTIRADEISNIIRERIEQYNREVTIVNTGTVLQVGDGIARIHGLTVYCNVLVQSHLRLGRAYVYPKTSSFEVPRRNKCFH